MELYHDSQSKECRWPQGAVPAGTAVRLRLFVSWPARTVVLRTWNGHENAYPMKAAGLGTWEVTITTMAEPHTLWYDFHAEDERGRRLYCGNASDKLGGVGAIYQDPPPSFQITVYDPAFDTPDYLRHGIMYQIFPDRFHRSKPPVTQRTDCEVHENWDDTPLLYADMTEGDRQAVDFFGGDLQGIIAKLPYLKDLGVSVLYLNPIFRARSNHRYDTGDYHQVDPFLGTNADFEQLCREAGKLGMRVMLDGVFSHTGDDSLYFNRLGNYPSVGAYQSKHSKYYPWYRFTQFPDRYACWWNIPTLPEINKDCPSFREFILGRDGVGALWVQRGACGWRLDVADELPMRFIRELRSSIRAEDPQAVLLGEVWEDASNKVAYGKLRNYCLGDTLDTVMNYPLRTVLIRFLTGQGDAAEVVRLVRSQQENYPVPFLYSLMNLMGSHDRARTLNMLVGQDYTHLPLRQRANQVMAPQVKALAVERLKKMLQIIIALPGMPSLYYGDEAGMEGAADPYNRGTYPWGREDKDLLSFVRDTFALRHARPVLRLGTLEIANEGADTLLIYRGATPDGKDAFGKPLADQPYLLRLTRDAVRL